MFKMYLKMYLHTILGKGMDSHDGLQRGVLTSGILKMEKYFPGLKVRFPVNYLPIYIQFIWI